MISIYLSKKIGNIQKDRMDTIPVTSLTGINLVHSKNLAKIGLRTVQDLLFHLPLRYEDRTHLFKIKDLIPGIYTTIAGTILNCHSSIGIRKIMICQVSDGSGILTIRFFNFNLAMKNKLTIGCHILAYGEVKRSKYGIEMIHPEYCIKKSLDMLELQKNTLTPIYSTTKGIKQVMLRKFIDQALDLLDIYAINELIPSELTRDMMSLPEALHMLHHPPSSIKIIDLDKGQHPAQKRLILEELLAHNLSMKAIRSGIQRFYAHPLTFHDNLKNKFLASLPFKLTRAQIRVVSEIENDMKLDVPMIRLIQGDVGSGKTLVAALTALQVISHGKQVAMMAPTELLVEQHVTNFRNWFLPLGVEVGWLVGKQKGKVRITQQEAIANGKIKMIVGTHAIFQKPVRFHNLALVIIDEQHRFGVHQRFALWKKGLQKGYYPHQLIMTATPIPRTLAMSFYSDINTSFINEFPKGKPSVNTVIIPNNRRNEIIDRIRYVCIYESRQVYWICTLIKESELLEVQSAESIWKELKLALPDLNIGLIHGRMKSDEKQKVIQRFRKNELHLLISTTVIEVGIDIPNASLMIIENAERLGLTQLHQLRGRIGRGIVASHCILLYKPPLSQIARIRLKILRESNDGFIIAQKDLEIRGPGEILGTRQTGSIEFKIANLLRDQELIPKIQRIAYYIQKKYPERAAALIDRWIPAIRCYSNI